MCIEFTLYYILSRYYLGIEKIAKLVTFLKVNISSSKCTKIKGHSRKYFVFVLFVKHRFTCVCNEKRPPNENARDF